MTKELKPCPFCGGGLHLEDWPWCDGTPCFEVWHDDFDHAVKMRCPIVMGGYDTEEDGTKAVNTRYKRTCKWLTKKRGTLYDVYQCSACGFEYAESRIDHGIKVEICDAKFCPNCGAEVVDGD